MGWKFGPWGWDPGWGEPGPGRVLDQPPPLRARTDQPDPGAPRDGHPCGPERTNRTRVRRGTATAAGRNGPTGPGCAEGHFTATGRKG